MQDKLDQPADFIIILVVYKWFYTYCTNFKIKTLLNLMDRSKLFHLSSRRATFFSPPLWLNHVFIGNWRLTTY